MNEKWRPTTTTNIRIPIIILFQTGSPFADNSIMDQPVKISFSVKTTLFHPVQKSFIYPLPRSISRWWWYQWEISSNRYDLQMWVREGGCQTSQMLLQQNDLIWTRRLPCNTVRIIASREFWVLWYSWLLKPWNGILLQHLIEVYCDLWHTVYTTVQCIFTFVSQANYWLNTLHCGAVGQLGFKVIFKFQAVLCFPRYSAPYILTSNPFAFTTATKVLQTPDIRYTSLNWITDNRISR